MYISEEGKAVKGKRIPQGCRLGKAGIRKSGSGKKGCRGIWVGSCMSAHTLSVEGIGTERLDGWWVCTTFWVMIK